MRAQIKTGLNFKTYLKSNTLKKKKKTLKKKKSHYTVIMTQSTKPIKKEIRVFSLVCNCHLVYMGGKGQFWETEYSD